MKLEKPVAKKAVPKTKDLLEDLEELDEDMGEKELPAS